MYQEGLNGKINIEYKDLEIQPNDKVLLFDKKGNSILKSQEDECFCSLSRMKNILF